MTLTPMDIHNKEFATKLRGYDSKQVDSFLDRIVDAYGDALDQIVDLKNENVELKKCVEKYDKVKDSINESLISAQENAEEIKKKTNVEAQEIIKKANQDADDILKKAQDDGDKKRAELRSQYDTLNHDYDLLKAKVEDFREAVQGMLKDQVKELSDSDWQYYLDKYYGRSRLYPADGSQPVEDESIPDGPMDNEVAPQENVVSANPEVDNNAVNEVNSVQEKEDKPGVLTGDSPVKESMHATEENTQRRDGPVIIFPDDLKNN